MERCKITNLPKLRDFYKYVIDNTQGMADYCRWIYGKHPTDEMIEDYIRQESMYFLKKDGEIIAAVAVTDSQNVDYHDTDWQVSLNDDEVCTVHILAIHPRFQKSGMARTIMEEIIVCARKKDKKAVRLDAIEPNTPAQRLYESMDFKKRGVKHWFAANIGWMKFYLYEYLL